MDMSYDVVVIGGGAAGLSAGLTLGRSRRSVLVIDGGEPRNAPAAHMHNYLSRDGVAPGELLAAGRAEVKAYGGEVTGGSVVSATKTADGFLVTLADGRVAEGRRLVVATGVVDRLPDIEGLSGRWGRDVVHCPYCHGWEVRDQPIGVVATGAVSVHQALLFRQLSADVVFFAHTAPPLDDSAAERLAARGIAVVEGAVVALDVEDDRVTGVRLSTGVVVPRAVVAVATRFVPRVPEGLGLDVVDVVFGDEVVGARVPTDATGATSVPGVWAAGNVADPMAQVISAAAAGTAVAAAINADLINEETALAVTALRS
ncbi:NAD(P)/FAD-dependent oxidoreductase [Actinokineospora sp. NBRC 105648]|uniref:NAD(P)/FAD-dependent oxidoreductase n=1 Tax=Actinokineospora sp. NBRC 105648 TaxID=3032206 RepID=UPI0024A3336E|nr:NAD(P)/FAD-dependent oxidoreductase [Actinokineospora sp. NBRC 105648]GLZ42757.1 thioredoxin reductase [Actinokineospora sp. NBRC 105648]